MSRARMNVRRGLHGCPAFQTWTTRRVVRCFIGQGAQGLPVDEGTGRVVNTVDSMSLRLTAYAARQRTRQRGFHGGLSCFVDIQTPLRLRSTLYTFTTTILTTTGLQRSE
jgi:hypothetical protein